MGRVGQLVRAVVIALLAAMGGYFVAVDIVSAAQSQEVLNERFAAGLEGLAGRTKVLEEADARARLQLIEKDMSEVKWLGRTVATAILTQIILAWREQRRRK